MATSGPPRPAPKSSYNVNLYCASCHMQIGIFENDWIPLTRSYGRPRRSGTNFATEVGNNTQVVPKGKVQAEAEGCEMAEVSCKKCSSLVGQFCRKAPDASKQHLVDQYFYKLSRTYLKDSQTALRVDMAFESHDDTFVKPPRPQSNGAHRMSTPSTFGRVRASVEAERRGRHSLGNFGDIDSPRGLPLEAIPDPSATSFGEDEDLARRLANLERLVSHPHVGHGGNYRPYQKQFPPTGLGEQHRQIVSLTDVMETLSETMKELRSLVQEMRAERTRSNPLDRPSSTSSDMDANLDEIGPSSVTELQSLREKNQNLKTRFRSISVAMGMPAAQLAETNDDSPAPAINRQRQYASALGKRARSEGHSKQPPPSGREAHGKSRKLDQQPLSPPSSTASNGQLNVTAPVSHHGHKNAASTDIQPILVDETSARMAPSDQLVKAEDDGEANATRPGQRATIQATLPRTLNATQQNSQPTAQPIELDPDLAPMSQEASDNISHAQLVQQPMDQTLPAPIDGADTVEFSDDEDVSQHIAEAPTPAKGTIRTVQEGPPERSPSVKIEKAFSESRRSFAGMQGNNGAKATTTEPLADITNQQQHMASTPKATKRGRPPGSKTDPLKKANARLRRAMTSRSKTSDRARKSSGQTEILKRDQMAKEAMETESTTANGAKTASNNAETA